MKKIIILITLFIFLVFINSLKNNSPILEVNLSLDYYNLLPEECYYLIQNNISYDEVKPYLNYSSFNIYDYFKYEKVRKEKKFTYLETVNYIKYPNYYNEYIYPQESIFIDSSLTLVNKSFYLNKNYVPSNLVNVNTYPVKYISRENEDMMCKKEALDNYLNLFQDASSNNIDLVIFSAYRSFEKQTHLFYNINNQNDKYSAKPGFSEHQAGLSLDISDTVNGLTIYLKDSLTYKWLINNSYKYGFILRYPPNKESKTKYSFEPWHYRYVGIKHATFIYKNNISLEEYLFSYFEL